MKLFNVKALLESEGLFSFNYLIFLASRLKPHASSLESLSVNHHSAGSTVRHRWVSTMTAVEFFTA
jgi:hypothetical protein